MKHPYLTARAGSCNFYFRRKVPVELRPILLKSEIWMSLETPCREIAAGRLRKAADQYDRIIEAAELAVQADRIARPSEDDWLPRGLRTADDGEPHPYHPSVQPPGW